MKHVKTELEIEIARINKRFLANDESHLWPINGRFNATKRAIRRIQRLEKEGLIIEDPLSYEQILNDTISEIVNNAY